MAGRTEGGLSERGRYWLGLVGAWERSGLTQAAFCHQQGVKHVTFCWWRRRLAQRAGRVRMARTSAAAGARRRGGWASALFAPVRIQSDEPVHSHPRSSGLRIPMDGRIEIRLGDNRRIRLLGRVDRQALADVLAVLEGTGDAASVRRGDAASEARRC